MLTKASNNLEVAEIYRESWALLLYISIIGITVGILLFTWAFIVTRYSPRGGGSIETLAGLFGLVLIILGIITLIKPVRAGIYGLKILIENDQISVYRGTKKLNQSKLSNVEWRYIPYIPRGPLDLFISGLLFVRSGLYLHFSENYAIRISPGIFTRNITEKLIMNLSEWMGSPPRILVIWNSHCRWYPFSSFITIGSDSDSSIVLTGIDSKSCAMQFDPEQQTWRLLNYRMDKSILCKTGFTDIQVEPNSSKEFDLRKNKLFCQLKIIINAAQIEFLVITDEELYKLPITLA